jgi:undecaprenyl-diphosphatase
MSTQQDGSGQPQSYVSGFLTLTWLSLTQVVRPPSNPRRTLAMRRSARRALVLVGIFGAAVAVLMAAVDGPEIMLMPPRGTPGLWPVRILSDFGKDTYLLWGIGALFVALAVIAPVLGGVQRILLLRWATRLQFLFLAVALSVLAGEVLKWAIGRGRPFVGGKADAFNFSPFSGTEAYASLPSSHAITAFALAFAVSAVWPRARIPMMIYAVVIAGTRLVLLAHHPSDVVAGALVGLIGAMVVQYWFAARRLGFAIESDGAIVSRPGPSRLKGVAREAAAP